MLNTFLLWFERLASGVMFTLLLGLILGPAIAVIVNVVSYIIFNILVTHSSDKVHKIDQILKQAKSVGPRSPDGRLAEGWHRAWYKGGWMLANRISAFSNRGDERVTYTIYFLGNKGYQELCKELTVDDDKVITIREEALSPWRSTDYAYNDTRSLIPHSRQSEIISEILKSYHSAKRALYLITGDAGVGKTTLGELVGRQLRKCTNMIVMKTCVNLTLPGKGVLDYFLMRDRDTILILEFNEYDIAMKTALGDEPYTNTEVSCLASSKISLNDLMDFLQQQDRLVIIASTNVLDLDKDDRYTSFLRRFDQVIKY